ncbi:MAG: sigma-54-dependent Fis family transcriptional regulator [Deltaproteobacteria bacterium]|nr:sigma-54-dependent Fis family transcriptional regulator [Deltaproteobacteria bacterium]
MMGNDAISSTIAVCAPPGSREAIARHLVVDCGWDVIDLGNMSADLVAGVRARADAYVLASDGATSDVLTALRERPDGRPLVAIGQTVCIDAAPDVWLPRLDAPLLTKTLKHLLPLAAAQQPVSEPPPSVAWRRKGDMIVGASPATRELLHTLDRLRASIAPVIVTGESGTGKELVARALHYGGPRARQPFIAINCAAIPESLFEAELFGYARGAFTGAVSNRIGAFEAAHQGTLFLDELGELPMAMQAKLLRVLETGEVVRLGSNEPRKVAVCVVAATNRSLADEVKAGRFREDLFYRLSVYPVHIAPLRTRPEDIAPIAAHYLELIAARDKRQVPRLTSSAVEKLVGYTWPGNVRELVNTLERAVLMAPDRILDGEHIVLNSGSLRPSEIEGADEASVLAYKDAKARFEQRYYTRILRATGGNVSMAAKLAQKTRKEIYDAAKRLGLEVTSYRRDDSEPPK